MEYELGKEYMWIPMHWKWDESRIVTVQRVYPRGKAMMSNGVICDESGVAMIYGSGKEVGRIERIE